MEAYKTLTITKQEGYAVVTVNRPEALNALNDTVIDELKEAFEDIRDDSGVGAAILTGAGKSFVAGADIAAMGKMLPGEARAFMRKAQEVMFLIENMEKPIIAAVNGFALGGGCELSMACDIRFASEKAKFGQPEVGLGILPGFGGTQRLPRLVGEGNAKYLIFGADIIDAAEAYRIGLVQKVYAPEALIEESVAYVKKILSKGPIAVRLSKSCINYGLDTDIKTGCALEAEAQAYTFSTEDHKEGLDAFVEKRTPEYKNK
ncbi:MAG: enoyl-CoA hydratase/isomerase family protein [Clostridiales Family XIII bacterium]|jgi:enoyl-CoA hydratase|nr:enoyl-CoA hydratase/isomerase family protein [Clostridiales Family XIII bacterium]